MSAGPGGEGGEEGEERVPGGIAAGEANASPFIVEGGEEETRGGAIAALGGAEVEIDLEGRELVGEGQDGGDLGGVKLGAAVADVEGPEGIAGGRLTLGGVVAGAAANAGIEQVRAQRGFGHVLSMPAACDTETNGTLMRAVRRANSGVTGVGDDGGNERTTVRAAGAQVLEAHRRGALKALLELAEQVTANR